MKTKLWEILVPASNNNELKFTYEHHKKWDAFVKKISGGVTITKIAKGEWVSPTGKLYVDRMIPCRIICTEEQILEIIDFTIDHYNQEAVMAYKISDDVIVKHKEEKRVRNIPTVPKEDRSQLNEGVDSNKVIKLPGRLIREGTIGTCPKCGSTQERRFWLWGKSIGCINSKCENYYKKEN